MSDCKHSLKEGAWSGVVTIAAAPSCVFCENDQLRAVYEAAKAWNAGLQLPCDTEVCSCHEHGLRKAVDEAIAAGL